MSLPLSADLVSPNAAVPTFAPLIALRAPIPAFRPTAAKTAINKPFAIFCLLFGSFTKGDITCAITLTTAFSFL